MAGIWNKDKEFWEYLRGFDMINIMETWIDEKGWKNLGEKLLHTHN